VKKQRLAMHELQTGGYRFAVGAQKLQDATLQVIEGLAGVGITSGNERVVVKTEPSIGVGGIITKHKDARLQQHAKPALHTPELLGEISIGEWWTGASMPRGARH
jgi:hypothetical protein